MTRQTGRQLKLFVQALKTQHLLLCFRKRQLHLKDCHWGATNAPIPGIIASRVPRTTRLLLTTAAVNFTICVSTLQVMPSFITSPRLKKLLDSGTSAARVLQLQKCSSTSQRQYHSWVFPAEKRTARGTSISKLQRISSPLKPIKLFGSQVQLLSRHAFDLARTHYVKRTLHFCPATQCIQCRSFDFLETAIPIMYLTSLFQEEMSASQILLRDTCVTPIDRLTVGDSTLEKCKL